MIGVYEQVLCLFGILLTFLCSPDMRSDESESFGSPPSPHPGDYIFMALLVLSRCGLWLFDLAHTQSMQTAIEPVTSRIECNSVQSSLTRLATLVSFAAAIAFPKPLEYFYLVIGSTAMVFTSAVLYTVFYVRRRYDYSVLVQRLQT